MAEFNLRSDSVNVEQIMEQIRARIREKRGVDYTEEQIRELATVKLEKFLDPRGVRSDLLDQFRRTQPPYTPPALPNYAFEEHTLYDSHRAPLRWIRRVLQPILKLFFNPNPLIQALHIQSQVNTLLADREARFEANKRAMEQLYYEVLHNLVVEMTKTAIEVKNLKMQVESLAGRLEFNERRARALESVVAYKPASEMADVPGTGAPAQAAPTPQAGAFPPAGEGPGQRSRRRRRRRGRRGSGSVATLMSSGQSPALGRPDTQAPGHPETAEAVEQELAAESAPTGGFNQEPPSSADAGPGSANADQTPPSGDVTGSGQVEKE